MSRATILLHVQHAAAASVVETQKHKVANNNSSILTIQKMHV